MQDAWMLLPGSYRTPPAIPRFRPRKKSRFYLVVGPAGPPRLCTLSLFLLKNDFINQNKSPALGRVGYRPSLRQGGCESGVLFRICRKGCSSFKPFDHPAIWQPFSRFHERSVGIPWKNNTNIGTGRRRSRTRFLVRNSLTTDPLCVISERNKSSFLEGIFEFQSN